VTSRTVRATLTFPDQVGQGAAVPPDRRDTATPWIGVLATLLTLGVAALLLIRRRRKRLRDIA